MSTTVQRQHGVQGEKGQCLYAQAPPSSYILSTTAICFDRARLCSAVVSAASDRLGCDVLHLNDLSQRYYFLLQDCFVYAWQRSDCLALTHSGSIKWSSLSETQSFTQAWCHGVCGPRETLLLLANDKVRFLRQGGRIKGWARVKWVGAISGPAWGHCGRAPVHANSEPFERFADYGITITIAFIALCWERPCIPQ